MCLPLSGFCCVALCAVGKYWTSEVQEAFDLQSTAGILDRDTFLRLLQEQQRKRIQRSHAAKETSAGQDSQSKATAGPNSVAAILASAGASGSGIKLAEAPAVGEASYRRKRPQLSLKLGAGAAAAGGAVKLGYVASALLRSGFPICCCCLACCCLACHRASAAWPSHFRIEVLTRLQCDAHSCTRLVAFRSVNPEAADVAKADFRRKRPQLSLQLGAGAAAGGGAVKLGFVPRRRGDGGNFGGVAVTVVVVVVVVVAPGQSLVCRSLHV